MHDNEFFVVDMSSCSSTGEIINSLSLALETLNHTGKKIVLKLGNTYLNQSQLLSIQSLITSYGCILDTVETTNINTAKIVENMNILVQEPIEKRIEEKYGNNDVENNFKLYTYDNKADNSIQQSELSDLHFEPILNIGEKPQENPNIQDSIGKIDTEKANNSMQINSNHADEQFSLNFSFPNKQNFEKFSKIETSNDNIGLNTLNSALDSKNDIKDINKDDTNDGEKNSMGVYKKAYDDFSPERDEWEEVDFYETPTSDPVISDTKTTMYINQTLRSGQIIESDGNVVIIGDCHPGSEIRAVGDITVWGILSGIAHAGYKGNINAKIRALKMNAVQLRISNCYSRRPDGTNIPYIIKSSVFTPEEARVVDNEIMLFKINQN